MVLLARAFSEHRASLKESHPIYFSSSASPGIVYIEMIYKNQYAYGTLGQCQDYKDYHFTFLTLGDTSFALVDCKMSMVRSSQD